MGHILIIDDEEPLRWTLRQLFESAGHLVAEAGNGALGLDLYRARPADLVIVDLLMPDMDGLETILGLRRRDPGAKIIAISGGGYFAGSFDFLPIAKKCGAQRVLHKPFALTEMEAAVRDLLGPGSA